MFQKGKKMDEAIRPYRPAEDKKKILELFKVVWGADSSNTQVAVWDWKFERNPANASRQPVIVVADSAEKIIGMVARLPFRLKFGQDILTVFWSVDFITHPDYRGEIGLKLGRETSHQKEPLLGFPLGPVKLFWKRYHSRPFAQVYSYVHIVDIRHLIRRKCANRFVLAACHYVWQGVRAMTAFLGPRCGSDVDIAEITAFGPEIDVLWKEASVDYQFLQVRDRAYLTWRFLECPHKKYRIFLARRQGMALGYIVIRDEEKNGLHYGYIVDIFIRKGESHGLLGLLLKAVKALETQGVDVITCYMVEHHKMYVAALRQAGFIFRKLSLTGMIFDKEGVLSGDSLVKDGWFLTRGDSDLDM